MLATASSLSVNPMFLRYDLLIELSRVELAMNSVLHACASEHDAMAELETRRAAINDTLRLLSA